jgi:hypothetical protein
MKELNRHWLRATLFEAQFGLVHCRFILHHLEHPRDVIAQMI